MTRYRYKNRRKSRKRRTVRRNKRLYGGEESVAIVNTMHSIAGFFSQFFFTCRTYLYAKNNKFSHFIENNKWQYTYQKGWHDYFTSLKDFDGSQQYSTVKRYSAHNAQDMPEYSIREYIECIKEIFILNDELKKRVEDYIATIGSEYTSLYVRRGDKITEMALIPIDDILSQTDIIDDGRSIFLQTDDYSVVGIIKDKFPSCKIFTLTSENSKGADNRKMLDWTPEERKRETEELLVSVSVFVRAKKGWTYYLSNVGTFHKLFGYDNINLYIDKHSRENVDKAYSLDNKGSPYSLTIE